MIVKERGLVKSRPTRNTKSKKQEMSSSQHTASKKKPPTTKAKKSTSAKHRFQKVGTIRSKGASNVSTSRKKIHNIIQTLRFNLTPMMMIISLSILIQLSMHLLLMPLQYSNLICRQKILKQRRIVMMYPTVLQTNLHLLQNRNYFDFF